MTICPIFSETVCSKVYVLVFVPFEVTKQFRSMDVFIVCECKHVPNSASYSLNSVLRIYYAKCTLPFSDLKTKMLTVAATGCHQVSRVSQSAWLYNCRFPSLGDWKPGLPT